MKEVPLRRTRIIIVVLSLFIALGLVFVSLALARPAAGVIQVVETPLAEPSAEETKSLAAEQQAGTGEAQAIHTFSAGGDGPLFVGLDDVTVPAFRIDVVDNTFSQAFVGTEVWGAAYDPDNDRVLFSSGASLYEWPVGGSVNFMGIVSDTLSVVFAMEGLAYYNGTLYASRATSTGEGEGIYEIDLMTLQAKRVIAYPDPAQTTIGGIDVDPVTGQLYGVNDSAALRGLVRIEPDGTVTVIGSYAGDETDVDGLAVGGGKAYLITDDPDPPYFAVFDLDMLTYTHSVTSPFSTSEIFAGGAWIAPPARPSYCSQPALAIPDNSPAGVTDALLIDNNGIIEDLDIRLDVSHSWVGDLILSLEHIDTGTKVTFFNRPGVPGSVAGCSGNNVAAFINDEGLSGDVETTCAAGAPTIAGNLVGGDPANDNLLAAFDGEVIEGTWRLTASDNRGADTGTLVEWCLAPIFTGAEIATSPNMLTSVQARDTRVTQTLTMSNLGSANLQWSIGELPAAAAARTGQPPAAGTSDIDLPWVSTDPVSGTIPGGSSMIVLVTFDSTGSSPAVYTGSLRVDSTDTSDPQITIPMTLTVSNASPVAAADVYAATADTTLTVSAPGVLGNDADADGDPLTAVLDTAPGNGSLMLFADGSFTYTPNMGFEGQDNFSYHAYDGIADSSIVTVTLEVASGQQSTYLPIVVKDDARPG